jgi:hypothetical protein
MEIGHDRSASGGVSHIFAAHLLARPVRRPGIVWRPTSLPSTGRPSERIASHPTPLSGQVFPDRQFILVLAGPFRLSGSPGHIKSIIGHRQTMSDNDRNWDWRKYFVILFVLAAICATSQMLVIYGLIAFIVPGVALLAAPSLLL